MEIRFLHLLIFRCFCAFFIRTFYNPDEYYQSMELAHKLAFGHGVQTWEWKAGVRSFFYPDLISIPYRILGYFQMDHPFLLLIIPRLMHAIFVAVGEYLFYKTVRKHFGEKVTNWMVFFMFINWFVFILSPRTLTNTVEMAFLMIVLSMFPYKVEKGKKYWSYLAVCTIAFYIRCTSAISFIPLGLYHIFKNFFNFLSTLTIALPISLAIVAAFIALDSYHLGVLCISPLQFFYINIWEQASQIFGTEVFHFYLTNTLPNVLLTVLPLFVFYLLVILSPFCDQEKKLELRIIASVLLFNIVITSLNPHKEDRFILPIIPLALLIAAFAATKIDEFLKKKTTPFVRKYLITWFITTTVLANVLQIVDKGLFYDHGRHHVVEVFRDGFRKDLKGFEHMQPSILFLGECYGYPLTCVLHHNYFETRYVSCKDQEYFLQNPVSWLFKYLKQLGPDSDYITHLMFTSNQLVWNMYNLLYATGFTGDITMAYNAIPDYKYRRGYDAILIRRDFSVKQEWWYYNETTSKWVFNLTMPPEFAKFKENATKLTELPNGNATSAHSGNGTGSATDGAASGQSKVEGAGSENDNDTDVNKDSGKKERSAESPVVKIEAEETHENISESKEENSEKQTEETKKEVEKKIEKTEAERNEKAVAESSLKVEKDLS